MPDPLIAGGALLTVAGALLLVLVLADRFRSARADEPKAPDAAWVEDRQARREAHKRARRAAKVVTADAVDASDDGVAGGTGSGLQVAEPVTPGRRRRRRKERELAALTPRPVADEEQAGEPDEPSGPLAPADLLVADDPAGGVLVPPLDLEQLPAAIGPLADAVAKLSKSVAVFAKRVEKDDLPDAGQARLVARLNRALVVADLASTRRDHLSGKSLRSLDRSLDTLGQLQRRLVELVLDVPGDAVQVLPLPFPAAFALHVPSFGLVEASDRAAHANVVFGLLDISPRIARANTQGSDAAMRAGADVGGFDDVRTTGPTQVATGDAEQASGKYALWKALDLPEPLPVRQRSSAPTAL